MISPSCVRLIVVVQLIGGLGGLLFGPIGFWFLDAWIGMALVSPIAVLVAATRNSRKADSGQPLSFTRAVSLFVIAVCLAGHGISLIQSSQCTQENLRRLTGLHAGSLSRIEIREPFSNQFIAQIEDQEALAQFSAAADATGRWTPRIKNAERIRQLHFVLVDHAENSLVFEWSQSSPAGMFGRFVERKGNWVGNRGEFQSWRLRDWYRNHVEAVLTRIN